jgi:eukaryotic-like serine/threonine-protein kinase
MKSAPDHVLSAAAADPVLAHLCDEIIERLQAGDGVDMASLALEHPDHADRLRRLLPALEALVDLGVSAAEHPSHGISAQDKSDLVPRVLGDYRILREVGRGGMGVVYEAEQRSLNRRVALKVLPMAAALDNRQFQRFQLEAQAAACLHHNNIVPVFAVGTEGGVPFYAMQYIEGRSLAEVIRELRRAEGLDREPLSPEAETAPRLADLSTTALARSLVSGQAATPQVDALTEDFSEAGWPLPLGEGARRAGEGPLPAAARPSKPASSTRTRDYCRNVAGLGLQAAEALDYAHTHGILHRDIKPGNLLLDALGRLWVTDFGLAQIQGNHGLTLSGDVLGTLRYMSPEQALGRGVVIDGRTDIYSLGVTLYELLTLQPAFDGKDRAEILRKIGEDDPKPLRKLNSSVPQDLETIVQKALAKAPSDRYATAGDLAEDLRKYLGDHPILARRPSLLDRAAKWGRRHTASVAAASVILVLAMIGLATSTILIAREQRRTAAAFKEADARLQFARKAVDEMYTEVAQKWLAQQSDATPLQRQFLERALAFYQRFAYERGADPAVRFEAAKAEQRVGDIQQKLGRHAEAEAAYHRALEMLEGLRAAPARLEHRQEFARTHRSLGGLLAFTGGLRDAEREYRLALKLRKAVNQQFPNDVGGQHDLADSHDALGRLLGDTGRSREAEAMHREAIVIYEALLTRSPANGDLLHKLTISKNLLAIEIHRQGGRSEDALVVFRRATESAERLVAGNPENPDYRSTLAKCLSSVGFLLHELGRLTESETHHRRSLKLSEGLSADFPQLVDYRSRLADSLTNLGIVLMSSGQLVPSEQVQRRALAIKEKLAFDHPDVPDYWSGVGGSLHNLSTVLGMRSHWDEARTLLERAIANQRAALKINPHHPVYRRFLSNHLALLNEQGGELMKGNHFSESEARFRLVLDQWNDSANDDAGCLRPVVAKAQTNLGILLDLVGRPNEAELAYRAAVEIKEALIAEAPSVLAHRNGLFKTLYHLGHHLSDDPKGQGRPQEAEAAYRRALELCETLAADAPSVREYRLGLAATLDSLGLLLQGSRLAEAEHSGRRAAKVIEALAADEPNDFEVCRDAGAYVHNLAETLRKRGEFGEARQLYERAIPYQCAALRLKPDDSTARQFLRNHLKDLGEILVELGDHAAAKELAKQDIPELKNLRP